MSEQDKLLREESSKHESEKLKHFARLGRATVVGSALSVALNTTTLDEDEDPDTLARKSSGGRGGGGRGRGRGLR